MVRPKARKTCVRTGGCQQSGEWKSLPKVFDKSFLATSIYFLPTSFCFQPLADSLKDISVCRCFRSRNVFGTFFTYTLLRRLVNQNDFKLCINLCQTKHSKAYCGIELWMKKGKFHVFDTLLKTVSVQGLFKATSIFLHYFISGFSLMRSKRHLQI